jgi:hypothetical protein
MRKRGQPTKYHRKYCKKIIEYFDIDPIIVRTVTFHYKNGETKDEEKEYAAELPTITGFAQSIKVDDDTIVEWAKRHKDFSAAYKRAKKIQEKIWLTNSLKGLYTPIFSIFLGKNVFGWKDKHEVENTGKIIIEEKQPK